jgi:DNA replication protein DnaC
LTGLDWAETPLPQAQVEQLASAAFMESAHNLILVGGTGTGKTHVATALGVAAIVMISLPFSHSKVDRLRSTVGGNIWVQKCNIRQDFAHPYICCRRELPPPIQI